jgi:hypothetical protein
MLTASFGRALTRPCFRRLAASLVLTATAPTMAGAQAPQPWATPAQMMERMCADHDAHFAARMAFIDAKIGLEAAQRPAWEAFVGAMRAAEKPIRDMCQSPPSADDPVAQLEALDRREIARAQMQEGRRAAVARLRSALASDQQRRLAEVILRHGPRPRPGPPGPPGAGPPNHPGGFGPLPPLPPPR